VSKGELQFIRWIQQQTKKASDRVIVGVGDDMAVLRVGDEQLLMTTDMLLDGVHFDTVRHSWDQIGRKAVACSLSDCAAMGAKPIAATASVALGDAMNMDDAQELFRAMQAIARRYDCPLVGGDTTSWSQPLAIDVCMLAEPALSCGPVLRSTARAGDSMYVTGPLGGSLAGRHLSFEPRLGLLDKLESLGDQLHAMMDISDGLALDLFRMCEASGLGAEVEDALLANMVHADALTAAANDNQDALKHALYDGEDFELLLAVEPAAAVGKTIGRRIGRFTASGLVRILPDGRKTELHVQGYEHFR
jgi:thiamine-monophosphate kinase